MSVYADLFRYRELFGSLFRRDVQARYRGSLLGVAWSLVYPLVLMGVYLLVFSTLWKAPGRPHQYPLYLLSGIALWSFFAGSLPASARSMLDNAALIRKTRFPRQLVPFSAVATNLVSLTVMVVALLLLDFALVPKARATEWLALPLIAVFVLMVGGIGLLLSAVNVVFRDVEHLLGAVLLPWFFVTPVLYSFEQIGALERHHTLVQVLYYGNFVTPCLTAIRDPLFFGRLPRATDVVYLLVAAAVALTLGALVFRRVDDQIAVEL